MWSNSSQYGGIGSVKNNARYRNKTRYDVEDYNKSGYDKSGLNKNVQA